MVADLLSASFRWWSLPFVLTTLINLSSGAAGAIEERTDAVVEGLLFVAVATAWWRPTRLRMISAHILSCAIKMSEMPRVWDGTWWFVMLSVPPIVVLLRSSVETAQERDAAFFELSNAYRVMCHVLYAGASLLKINRDFLDVEYSCAPILAAQLVTRLPEEWGLDDWGQSVWLTRLFPLLTVLVELGVPVLTVMIGPAAGVALGLGLHFGIAITPGPNNAGSFSVTAALWYLGFLPVGIGTAVNELLGRWDAPGAKVPAWGVVTLGLAAAAYASGLTTCDASGFAYVVQMGVCARAVAIERKASPHDDAQATKPTRTGAARIGVAVALYYAFGTAVLGTWDMGIDHPYSNLRMHSGPSNHYFLPLGILHKVPPFAEMWPPRLPWAGGPVLVEAATSAYFLTQGGIPGDVSADLTPRAAALLRRSGHRGLQFFSVAKRFSTTTVANSPWSSDERLDPRAFIPFTIPAFELRRLLSEGALGSHGSLTYSRGGGLLPGKRTTIHVTTGADGAVASCTITHEPEAGTPGGVLSFLPWLKKPCAADELALLPPIPEWLLRVLPIYNAYPLLDGDIGERPTQSLICYG